MFNLIPRWTSKNISIPIEIFKKASLAQMISALHFIGQEFSNNARLNGSYKNQTLNLRSSIGYAIYNNGKEVGSKFESAEGDKGNEGIQAAKKLAKEKSKQKGLVLIVIAGMEYAAAVESKGRNVLTIFAPSESKVKSDLKKLLRYV